jgi:hypothetical protein
MRPRGPLPKLPQRRASTTATNLLPFLFDLSTRSWLQATSKNWASRRPWFPKSRFFAPPRRARTHPQVRGTAGWGHMSVPYPPYVACRRSKGRQQSERRSQSASELLCHFVVTCILYYRGLVSISLACVRLRLLSFLLGADYIIARCPHHGFNPTHIQPTSPC